VGVPHPPRYRHYAEGAKNVTACPMYVNISLDRCRLASGRSMTMAQVFFLLTFNPHQMSDSRIAFNRA
jgi:hypothetical protein